MAGTSTNAGGGSGGSILISTKMLSGSGTISANGGFGTLMGGGGGGGRIAITYDTNLFTGTISAYGAGGYSWGGAGTIYLKSNIPSPGSLLGTVIVDNGGRAGTNTTFGTSSSPTSINLNLQSGGVLALLNSQAFGNLVIGSNAWLCVSNYYSSPITITVSGNAQIQSGGGISADGAGAVGGAGQGPGRPATSSSTGSSGGGYGGYGAATAVAGGIPYGMAMSPSSLGSGGGTAYAFSSTGGPGGGAIRLNATGLLQMDGAISADGKGGLGINAGGGSGGSLWLTVGGLSGSGVISASGGAGNALGGGGGGGRIAVFYQSNNFTGILKAWGAGSGTNYGGAGTIYHQGQQPIDWPDAGG